ncbi:peptidase, C39 family [Leptospira ryugenii]|uniref:Peptidase, C39 family n=1 Tax=Leptospira ryugenii TaxID=1917863 RepID=A0A2P2E482_9LEPT|nr:peptidase domain-containing ABC transporter [Leptospira ryugenii]GBF51695.1 peptidase, C39 family [Leptospira ryugenii]
MNPEILRHADKIRTVFRNNYLFADLDPQELEDLFPYLTVKFYNQNQTIISKDSGTKFVHIVLNGRIGIKTSDNISLGYLEVGESIGERMSITGNKSTATYFAHEPLIMVLIPVAQFKQLIQKFPYLEEKVRRREEEQEKFHSVRKLSFFRELDPEDIRGIIKITETISCEEDEYLFHEGDEGNAAYIIKSGKVHIRTENPKKLISIMKAGDILGEIAIFKKQKRLASAITAEPSIIYKIPGDAIRELLGEKKGSKLEEIVQSRLLRFTSYKEKEMEEDVLRPFDVKRYEIGIGIQKSDFFQVTTSNPVLVGLACTEFAFRHYEKPLPNNWKVRIKNELSRKSNPSLFDLAIELEKNGFLTKQLRVRPKQLKDLKDPFFIADEENLPVAILMIDVKEEAVLISHPTKGILEVELKTFYRFWDGMILTFSPSPPAMSMDSGLVSFVKELRALFRPHVKEMRWIVGATIISACLSLSFPYFLREVIDRILLFADFNFLLVLSIGVGLSIIFQSMFTLYRNLLTMGVLQNLEYTFLVRFFHHILHLSLNDFRKLEPSDYTLRLQENQKILEIATRAGVTLVLDLVTLPIFITVLLFADIKLTLLGIAFLLLYALIVVRVSSKIRSLSNLTFESKKKTVSYLLSILGGITLIKINTQEQTYHKKGMNEISRTLLSELRIQKRTNFLFFIGKFFEQSGMLAIMTFGITNVIEEKISLGTFLGFQIIFSLLVEPIIRICRIYEDILEMRQARKRLMDVYLLPSEYTSTRPYGELPRFSGKIRLDHVYFKYKENEPFVLHDIHFEVNAGEKIAIVGKNGSGKTTLIRLLTGILRPTEGRVFFDSFDLSTLDPEEIRIQLGIVEQNPILFSGSIAENICKKNPSLSKDAMLAGAKIAAVDRFVDRFPFGYQTKLGEGGAGLSGGQKQRLAIARAFVSSPSILFLDEPTASLDAESEHYVQSRMEDIFSERTIVFTSHKLQTIVGADKIIVLDEGKIVEMGTHAELFAKKGVYYYYFKLSEGSDNEVE